MAKAGKSKILLIYTGGTIGMVRDSKNGALKAFNFDNLLRRIPEIKLLDCFIDTISFDTPIDSSNVVPENWVEMSEIIENHYEDYDGFVILHGSDTMSYSASALSFMLENLRKPIIFTGSQLPIGDLRTDAKENLITSIQIAALQKNNMPVIKEVGLYFEYKLYRGNRTTKINAEHFSAFKSFNYPKLIESGVYLDISWPYLFKPSQFGTLKVHKAFCKDVIIVKLFPGIQREVLEPLFSITNIKGIIIETFGSGNTVTAAWFNEVISNAIVRGVYVINVTQCAKGRVKMGQYETSTHLKALGVISASDMTSEAAVTKLMFLLKKASTTKEFKQLYQSSLRGELTEEST